MKKLKKYKIINVKRDREFNNNNKDIENTYSIYDQFLFEMIILAIRGETIKYSSMEKRENIKQEKELEEDIEQLERNVTENLQLVNKI